MNFQKNLDPKESLQIGINSPRNFECLDDARTWLMQNHVAILDIDGLCKPFPTPEQFDILRKWVSKYITISGKKVFPESNNIVGGIANLYRELNDVKKIMERSIIARESRRLEEEEEYEDF